MILDTMQSHDTMMDIIHCQAESGGRTALRDEDDIVLMRVPSRGSKLATPSLSRQPFTGGQIAALKRRLP